MNVRRDPLGFYVRLAREAGPFAHFTVPSGTALYFVNDPALVREVLVTRPEDFIKWNFNEKFAQVFGQGLIGSQEPRHRQMSRVARPAFQSGRSESYARQMTRLIGEQLAGWREGPIDLTRAMNALTLEVVAHCLLGIMLEPGEPEAIHAASDTLQRHIMRLGNPAGADERAFAAANAEVTRLVRGLLARHRAAVRAGETDDLVDLLLAAGRHDPDLVTAAQIEDELRTFLLAGYVTTASALSCACWLLARHSEAGATLARQVRAVLGDRAPAYEDLPALADPCEAVFLETLRLYPPGWGFGRETTRELILGGYTLPAGANLVICPWLLHRDPDRFPEPECFLPARWTGGELRTRLPRGSFLPFSAGTRSCLGERFATMEATLVLATVVQCWTFSELPGRPDPGWTPRVTLWPQHGVTLRITPAAPPLQTATLFTDLQ